MSWIDFSDAPLIGFVMYDGGQRYEAINVEPYVRKDGQGSFVVTWASECMDCGAWFEFTSGLKQKAANRRCHKHRKPRIARNGLIYGLHPPKRNKRRKRHAKA